MMRSSIIIAAIFLLSFLSPGRRGLAAEGAATEPSLEVKMDKKTQQATAAALKWLAGKQNPDGSWSASDAKNNTGITSFALLAFMSQGHLPGQGEYGPEVAKGTRFLIHSAREDGYLVGPGNGNMYCHGLATLALAELWGMAGGENIRPVLKKATDLIIRCQNPQGGWRYDPVPADADISVTIMQVMALRAAKNSGIAVPNQTLDRAISYIRSMQDAASGGFGYQNNSAPGFSRTAAGVCVLQFCGQYDAKEIASGVQYLWGKAPFFGTEQGLGIGGREFRGGRGGKRGGQHFWYGQYYAAHAMHQVGGKMWRQWYAAAAQLLLEHQSPEGYWDWNDSEKVGTVYQTSIAVIVLSIPAGYVPIFQR